jgi:hypothetical protein
MKKHSFWLIATCIISIPCFLFYLYQFGYSIVDKTFRVSALKNSLGQQTISDHYINYSEIISPVIIVLLLLIITHNFKKQSKSLPNVMK